MGKTRTLVTGVSYPHLEADIYQDHGLTQINLKGQRILRRSSGSKFA
jgi:hypothetical protein